MDPPLRYFGGLPPPPLSNSIAETLSRSDTHLPPMTTTATYHAPPIAAPHGHPNFPPPSTNPRSPIHDGRLHLNAFVAHQYGQTSVSPSTATSGMSDGAQVVDHMFSSQSAMSPGHLSSASLSQKRAYRQRRKDPSCDACRERKVKCDATDTSSCSECSSRSVRCQFTKETNRRMSSIKQVQDLEKQLAQARQQINSLRGALQSGGAMDVDRPSSDIPELKLPDLGPNSGMTRKSDPPPLEGFNHVRRNIRNYGRGIFKPPPRYRQRGQDLGAAPGRTRQLPDLPPKHVTDKLVATYRMTIHPGNPILHWPTFMEQYENVYRQGSFEKVPPVWVAMFYALLACAKTHVSEDDGPPSMRDKEAIEYMLTMAKFMNTWTDNLVIDHARAMLLISIFFAEMDLAVTSWIWLGSAIRSAQELGLHTETGPWSPIDGEMRRRIWWNIYARDRLVSLETGRPLSIDDDDCDVGWPCPVDDEDIHEEGIRIEPGSEARPDHLKVFIPVVRTIPHVIKSLKSPVIAAATLETYDVYFQTLCDTVPDVFQVNSSSPLPPADFIPACAPHLVRTFIYRHNLSTYCTPPQRRDALTRYLSVALDTVNLAARMVEPFSPAPAQPWEHLLASLVPSYICTHLWRCLLILSFAAHYDAARLLVRLCAAIGNHKRTNVACGRHVVFFLAQLSDRILPSADGGQAWSLARLQEDEEMLVYLSGDMQAGHETSWVWAGSETGKHLSSITAAGDLVNGLQPTPAEGEETRSADTPTQQQPLPPPPGSPKTTVLNYKESVEWGGWEKVDAMLVRLMDVHNREQREDRDVMMTRGDESKRDLPAPLDAGRGRISIANISI